MNYAMLIYDDDAGWADLPDEEKAELRAAGDASSGSRSSRSSARPIRTSSGKELDGRNDRQGRARP